jgi:perosamine synthetase
MKPGLERTAAEVMGSLDKKGIGTRPFFFPLHHQPVLRKYGFKFEKGTQPQSELLGTYGFYIPNGLGMSLHETERVAQAVRETILER